MPMRRRPWARLGAFFLLLLAAIGAQAANSTVLVVGDSLSAGYGIAPDQGWVSLLGQRLKVRGWQVANASISGETSAGGAARIAAELQRTTPRVVVIALGSNDGLRGLPPDQLAANLSRMIEAAKNAGARVLLVGNRIPPNYGADYSDAVFDTFATLAQRYDTALVPFLLEPLATSREAFQDDNMHPTAAAQPALLAHVWPALEPLLPADKE